MRHITSRLQPTPGDVVDFSRSVVAARLMTSVEPVEKVPKQILGPDTEKSDFTECATSNDLMVVKGRVTPEISVKTANVTFSTVSFGRKMKAILTIFLMFTSISVCSAELKKVSFYTDTVSEIGGRVIKFLMGSTWIMEREIIALPLSEGVIVCDGSAPEFRKERLEEYAKALPKAGVLMYSGQTVNVTRVDGIFLLRNGFLGRVVASFGDGAILKTDDGSLWSIPQYDRYDTGYWLPPYPVLIFGNEQYLINLKKGKKVWVEKRIK
jgi:hypothetical protein